MFWQRDHISDNMPRLCIIVPAGREVFGKTLLFIPEKGFFEIEPISSIFQQKMIPKEEVPEFVRNNKALLDIF